MNKDIRLIYEAYKDTNRLVSEGIVDTAYFLLQVIDPTGLLSWKDAGVAIESYEKDSSAINLCLMILAIFCALPNLGILAAGYGGIGWAGVKAAAKSAIKAAATSPSSVISLTNSILKNINKIPGMREALLRSLNKLKNKNVLSPNAFDDVYAAISKGKIDNIKHAENIMKGRGGMTGIENIGKADQAIAGYSGKAAAGQGAVRGVYNAVEGETGVDSIMGDKFKIKDGDDGDGEGDIPAFTRSGTSTGTGRTVKRP